MVFTIPEGLHPELNPLAWIVGTVARHHELGTIALAIVKRNTPVDATLSVDGIPASQQVIV